MRDLGWTIFTFIVGAYIGYVWADNKWRKREFERLNPEIVA
jgi:hypothetical protein